MVSKKYHGYLLFWFISVWSFSELIQESCSQQIIHDDEVRTLRQMAVTMGSSVEFNHCGQISGGVNITCGYCNDGVCHVTDLRLKEVRLNGTLPPELVNLTYLKIFDITRNFLHGPLPPIWSTMNLTFISLTANRLSGEIPVEWGNFPNLDYLSFEANNFSGSIPKELGDLVNLTHLFFSSNKFVGTLPANLINLKKLQDFRLSDNNFEGSIPDFIQNFTQLNRLEMFASGLEGPIPASLFQNLESLQALLITDMGGTESQFPTISSSKTEINLVLRNVNLSGTIPDAIWGRMSTLDMLDVSFNNLEGQPSSATNTAKHIILSGNKLNGSVPQSFLQNSMVHNIDLSYNNFSWPSTNCKNNLNRMNTYRSSSLQDNNVLIPCSEQPICQQSHKSSLHINCGGPTLTTTNENGSLVYEADIFDGYGSAKIFRKTFWGFSSTGDFMNDNNRDNSFIRQIEGDNNLGPLYSTARRSPLSLTYFACLENGNYTVKLHFAEIEFIGEFKGMGRRLFDIFIQGNRVTRDFNIDEEASRSGSEAVVKEYLNVSVTNNNTLEIRFYWAGKGTRIVPRRGNYGILISAISVCPSHKSHCEEHKETSNIPIVVGVVASVLCLIFVVAGFIVWKKRRHNKYKRERSELGGLEMIAGSFTLRQLRAATNDFNPENKIGEGGFGSVYKGQLSDGTVIAVKQLSSKSRQGNREFVTEIGMISGLKHPNLVKLYGCCIERNQLLLVYEYMENNCLGRALFGGPGKSPLNMDWAMRFKICVGIAEGLFFLHEGSPLRIVHRDIKPTNVLLDKDLNAKISDFGLAKLFEEENCHVSTRIAGTVGYMAPEYALWGNLTEKADVYSFGVVALEIISGKSNTQNKPQSGCVCLIDYAFVLQSKGDLLEIMDPKLGTKFNKDQAERVIKVALLCTNASPVLRPTMSEVIDMLNGCTNIRELVSDPCIYGDTLANDLRFKALKDYYQQTHKKNNSIDATTSSNNDSAQDLYKIKPDSLTISGQDLYQISFDSPVKTSDISSLISSHTSSNFHDKDY